MKSLRQREKKKKKGVSWKSPSPPNQKKKERQSLLRYGYRQAEKDILDRWDWGGGGNVLASIRFVGMYISYVLDKKAAVCLSIAVWILSFGFFSSFPFRKMLTIMLSRGVLRV